MSWLDIVRLGVVQGATEFLPISSSGHLVVARHLFGIPDVEGGAFDAFLHLGTLAAVLLYFWRVWWGIGRSLAMNDEEGKDKRELAAKLAIATVPAAATGYFFQNAVLEAFRTPRLVAAGLLLTAVVLLVAERLARRVTTIRRASFYDAWLIGLAQVVSLLPGVSRSGITIAAGQGRGLSRSQAAVFSFLMSAPIIAGAGLTSLGSLLVNGSFSATELVAGFTVSFVSGLVAIHLLLKMIKRVSFLPFAIYVMVLAGIVWYVG